ncbi:MAG: monomethylamine transporter [Methanomethylovorans sp.]|uniref:monomethylamine transporter n=1 Tax=Methanomethylovorans sp. TaxID=2758717 RepID=UPI000A688687|nr:monomethylamine transporter [Methanomethylovorans sp.]
MSNINNNRYHSKLYQDAGVIVLLLALLYFSELFMIYNVLSTIGTNATIPSTLLGLYALFITLLLGIETLGCMGVYRSIKKHMFEFEYYD